MCGASLLWLEGISANALLPLPRWSLKLRCAKSAADVPVGPGNMTVSCSLYFNKNVGFCDSLLLLQKEASLMGGESTLTVSIRVSV